MTTSVISPSQANLLVAMGGSGQAVDVSAKEARLRAEGSRRLGDLLGEEWEVAPYGDAATLASSAAHSVDDVVGLRDRTGGEIVPVRVEVKIALTPAAAQRLAFESQKRVLASIA